MDEMALLQRYVESQDPDAFGQLVRQQGDWLYSSARRQLGDEHLAEDVTQAVFLLLARRAKGLTHYAYLGGWLFTTLKYCVREAKRHRVRLVQREREAAKMRSQRVEDEADWTEISPVLDQALSGLGRRDREAVLLRFYQERSLAEVGRALGVSEEAARKRVTRALEKLRSVLAKKGVTAGVGALGVVMTGKLTEAAPAGLMKAAAAAGGGGAGSAGVIAKGAIRMITWAKIRVAAMLLAGIGLPLAVAGAVLCAASGKATPGGASVLQTPAVAPATRPAEAAVAVPQLPQEVAVLVSGWEDNVSRIQSLDAAGSITIHDRSYEACKDLDGKSYPAHTAQFHVAREAGKTRIDTEFDREFDTLTNKVTYHLPYGAYVLPGPTPAQKEELYRDRGTVMTTRRILALEGEVHTYDKEDNYARVERPSQRMHLAENEIGEIFNSNPLSRGGPRSGLRDLITGKLRGGFALSVEEHDGKCSLVCRGSLKGGPTGSGAVRVDMVIVIAPRRGYTIESVRTTDNGELVGAGEYEYTERGGVWVLTSSRERQHEPGKTDWTRTVEWTVDLATLKVNVPVDRSLFTVESLGIGKGALVRNRINEAAQQ